MVARVQTWIPDGVVRTVEAVHCERLAAAVIVDASVELGAIARIGVVALLGALHRTGHRASGG